VFCPSLAVGYSKWRAFYVTGNVTLQQRVPKSIKDLTLNELVLHVYILSVVELDGDGNVVAVHVIKIHWGVEI
jgi:hypothetical protein